MDKEATMISYQPHIEAVIGLARAEGCRVRIISNKPLKDGAAGTFLSR